MLCFHLCLQTLRAVLNDNDKDLLSVLVLDVDAISQVKNKILDAMFKNKPYSSRPAADDVDLGKSVIIVNLVVHFI